MQTAMRRSCRCLRAPVKGASKSRLASTAAPAAKANSRLALQLAALTLTATAAYALGSSAADLRTVKPSYQPPTEAGFATALAEIKQLLPEDCLSQAENDLMAHGTSDWQYHLPAALPGAVLYPRSTEDVAEIVKIAGRYHIPVIPFAGGTSLEAHFFCPDFVKDRMRLEADTLTEKPNPGLAFSIDFGENMNQIVAIHEGDLDVVVQPGIGYEPLNEQLKPTGMFFPVDPGPVIGGMLGTGCSDAYRYGTMRDNVLNLTIVMPDGEIIKTRQRAKKCSAGPDFGRYFIGSEGTLGIVTEATLKLAPILPYSVGVSSFPTVEAAASCVRDLVQQGVNLQCIELLDDDQIRCANKQSAATPGARIWPEQPALFLKFQGSEQVMKSDVQRTAQLVQANNGTKLAFAKNDREKEELWYSRKVALWSALDYYAGSRCIVTDVCVPISQFPTLMREIKEDVQRTGLAAPIVSHAADGNVHALIMFKTEEERERAMGIVHRMVERAQRLDGTCTGEHGVGIGKSKYLETELGKGTVRVLRQIKETLDPLNIMNPGKLLPPKDA